MKKWVTLDEIKLALSEYTTNENLLMETLSHDKLLNMLSLAFLEIV